MSLKKIAEHPISIMIGYLSLTSIVYITLISLFGKIAGGYFSVTGFVAVHYLMTGGKGTNLSPEPPPTFIKVLGFLVLLVATGMGIYHLLK